MSFDPLDENDYPLKAERLGPAWRAVLAMTEPGDWIPVPELIDVMLYSVDIAPKTADQLLRNGQRAGFLERKREGSPRMGVSYVRRRADYKPAPKYTDEQLVARLSMTGGLCGICKWPLSVGGGQIHADHTKPLAVGGADMLCNLRPAHAECNWSKNRFWEGPRAA